MKLMQRIFKKDVPLDFDELKRRLAAEGGTSIEFDLKKTIERAKNARRSLVMKLGAQKFDPVYQVIGENGQTLLVSKYVFDLLMEDVPELVFKDHRR